jgi:hypothetical protein
MMTGKRHATVYAESLKMRNMSASATGNPEESGHNVGGRAA